MKTGWSKANRKDRLEGLARLGLKLEGNQNQEAWRFLMSEILVLCEAELPTPKFNDLVVAIMRSQVFAKKALTDPGAMG